MGGLGGVGGGLGEGHERSQLVATPGLQYPRQTPPGKKKQYNGRYPIH